ncbi:GntR family transcriptional regulator [Nocardia asiatica]|uniref:GntR family transcriptional regulator n=1 Tax=Nocardia asiatica TaxID=209252 RepID=UPI0002DDBF07|nr:GntR family transcriptional regulator [Nocardia asiatica]
MTTPARETVPLGEAAYKRIRDSIVSCKLAPGQRLTEPALAESTGFGASPIREALTRLDHEGLILTMPRKGYRVKPLTIKSVNDLFEFWLVFGPEVVRQGILRATDAQLAEIVAGAEEASRLGDGAAPVRDTARKEAELAERLFGLLAEATGNEYFQTVMTRLSAELLRVWALVIESELLDSGNTTISEAFVVGAARRDGNALARHCRTYTESSHLRVLRTLARWPSVIASEVGPVIHSGDDPTPPS